MKPVVTFGEIMGRWLRPENIRLRQTCNGTNLCRTSQCCSIYLQFWRQRAIRHCITKTFISRCSSRFLRSVGIDTQYILRTDQGRLGLYFLETGANQRPSNVIYDRADSSLAMTPASAYDWPSIFTGAQWLHLSGITPALSKKAAEATIEAAQQAKQLGCMYQ